MNWLNRSVPVHEAHGRLVKALGESWCVSHDVRISSEICDDVRCDIVTCQGGPGCCYPVIIS